MKNLTIALLVLASSQIFAMQFTANPIVLYSNAGSKMAADLGFYLRTSCSPVVYSAETETPLFAYVEERGYVNSYPIFSDIGKHEFTVVAGCVGATEKAKTTVQLIVR